MQKEEKGNILLKNYQELIDKQLTIYTILATVDNMKRTTFDHEFRRRTSMATKKKEAPAIIANAFLGPVWTH